MNAPDDGPRHPAARRRFIVIGARATASPDFRLNDLPGTSGRLDVLLRCVRAAMLFSHGLRRDVVVYLVLLGGASAPRVVRVDGAAVRFLRPDERSLAVLVQKALAAPRKGDGFVDARPGVAVADGGLDAALDDVGSCPLYVLDEGGDDIRGVTLDGDVTLVLGDHHGFDAVSQARLDALGARRLRVGPVSVHADDAVAIVSNELDRIVDARTTRGG